MPDLHENDLRSILSEARSHLLSADYDMALKLYLAALSMDENNLAALNALGFILYFKKDYSKGMEYAVKAVETYPEDAYARKGLGLYLAKQGKLEEAVESMKRAIEIDPDFVDAYHDLAFIYYEFGNFDEARVWITEGVKRCKDIRYKELFGKFSRRLDELELKKL